VVTAFFVWVLKQEVNVVEVQVERITSIFSYMCPSLVHIKCVKFVLDVTSKRFKDPFLDEILERTLVTEI
jgi:hypothetical protein